MGIDEKIKEAARVYSQEHQYAEGAMGLDVCIQEEIHDAYKAGFHDAIEEFLKELWHPAREEPKNLENYVYASEIFGETYFFTVQRDNSKQSWKTEVACHGIDKWAYSKDIGSLFLKKEGSNEGA